MDSALKTFPEILRGASSDSLYDPHKSGPILNTSGVALYIQMCCNKPIKLKLEQASLIQLQTVEAQRTSYLVCCLLL